MKQGRGRLEKHWEIQNPDVNSGCANRLLYPLGRVIIESLFLRVFLMCSNKSYLMRLYWELNKFSVLKCVI